MGDIDGSWLHLPDPPRPTAPRHFICHGIDGKEASSNNPLQEEDFPPDPFLPLRQGPLQVQTAPHHIVSSVCVRLM